MEVRSRIRVLWRIYGGFWGLAVATPGALLVWDARLLGPNAWMKFLLGAAFIGAGVLFVLMLVRERMIWDNRGVTQVRLFGTRFIAYKDIHDITRWRPAGRGAPLTSLLLGANLTIQDKGGTKISVYLGMYRRNERHRWDLLVEEHRGRMKHQFSPWRFLDEGR